MPGAGGFGRRVSGPGGGPVGGGPAAPAPTKDGAWGCRVWGLGGFEAWGLGFGVWGLGFRFRGSYGVGLGFRCPRRILGFLFGISHRLLGCSIEPKSTCNTSLRGNLQLRHSGQPGQSVELSSFSKLEDTASQGARRHFVDTEIAPACMTWLISWCTTPATCCAVLEAMAVAAATAGVATPGAGPAGAAGAAWGPAGFTKGIGRIRGVACKVPGMGAMGTAPPGT